MNQKTAQKKAQRAVDDWNAKYPVGQKVMVHRDNGVDFPTITRSEAQVLSGHSPVVWIEGIAGCYHLDFVEAI